MKKLPKNLYHFTSPIHLEFIREDSFLKLTDSNLKIDRATYRIEPLYRGDEKIGEHAVNKYSNHHPVVWLTANAEAAADENGLSDQVPCRSGSGKLFEAVRWFGLEELVRLRGANFPFGCFLD